MKLLSFLLLIGSSPGADTIKQEGTQSGDRVEITLDPISLFEEPPEKLSAYEKRIQCHFNGKTTNYFEEDGQLASNKVQNKGSTGWILHFEDKADVKIVTQARSYGDKSHVFVEVIFQFEAVSSDGKPHTVELKEPWFEKMGIRAISVTKEPQVILAIKRMRKIALDPK